jgi:hypothetical protein
MAKRVTWFVLGTAAGVSGTVAAGRKVRKTVEQMAPTRVAKRGADAVRAKAAEVRDAVSEGVAQMRYTEAELKSRITGEPMPDDVVDPDRYTRTVIEVVEVGSERGGRRARVRHRKSAAAAPETRR